MNQKPNTPLQTRLLSAACGLLLLGATSAGWAQGTNTYNNFDSSGSTASFVNNWWGIGPTISWDGTLDAANDSASGSVRYDAAFTGAGGEQFMTHFTIAGRWGWDGATKVDCTTYTNLSFDIKVDPASAMTPGGNYGNLELSMTSDGWGTLPTIGWNIPLTATNWTHHNLPITASWVGLDKVVGWYVKMWSNGAHTNHLIFNIDNVKLEKPGVAVVIPPPTVALTKSIPGLNLLASGTGQYDRQQVRTVDSTFSWVGSSEPVTYQFTIKNSPGAVHNGFQAHMFLVPNSTDTAPSIDWNTPNIVWFNVQTLTNGGGEVAFRYKTNGPSANAMLFNTNLLTTATNADGTLVGVGNLGTITSTKILGTWKMTFTHDTNVTVVAADGTTTNYTISAAAANLFSGSLQVFFGAQPNSLDYAGYGYVFSNAKVSTPSAVLMEDDFSGVTLDTSKWAIQASDAPGVFVVPPTSPWSLAWTLPATAFSPEITTNLARGSTWVAPVNPTTHKVQGTVRVLLEASELSAKANFFRMIKRQFTQLQVLLPGETNAPNTLTGKTGAPTPVTAGDFVTVTINAVDATFHIVNASDTVHLTTTDGAAITPNDASLANGTLNQTVQFNTAASQTVTATDVTDGTKLPNTSSALTVQ